MAEIVKTPRPWWKTLQLIALPLYVANLIMGILMGDFVGGVIAGGVGCMLIFKLVTAIAEDWPKAK